MLISRASRVIPQILQVRLQQYAKEIPYVQAGFRKGRGTRDQIANICWIIGKQDNYRTTSALLTMLKPLTFWIPQTVESLRDGNTRPPDLPLEKHVCRSRSNS